MSGFDDFLKQARDFNQRAAALHAQAEETHAKDRVGQLYFKVFLVAFAVVGIAVATSALGWDSLSSLAAVIGAVLLVVLIGLFAVAFAQRIWAMLKHIRNRWF